MHRKKVLAVPRGDIFLERDVAVLKEYCEVRTTPGFSYKNPLTILPCSIGILRGVLWADVTFSQFADMHAFIAMIFAKILRKKSMVVVGGYEVAKVPEIGYGYMLKPIVSSMVKLTLTHTDRVLTVVDSLKDDAIKNAKISGGNIYTVPECYDADVWQCTQEKQKLVITVANKMTHKVIKRKGLEAFVKAAKLLPDTHFVIIGPFIENSAERHLKSLAPSNVEFAGFVPSTKLPELYSRAQVYCQLSRYEGIPNAMCEAMLCECIPVVTDYCGIPVAVGDTGFYVPYNDAQKTAKAITEAMRSEKGKEARHRIKNLFPLERRRRELQIEIEKLTEN